MSGFFEVSPSQRRAASLFDRIQDLAQERYHPVFLLAGQLRETELSRAPRANQMAVAESLVDIGEDFLAAVNASLPSSKRYGPCAFCGSLYCNAHYHQTRRHE